MLTDSQYNQLIALLQEVLSELNEKERTKEKEKNIVVVQDNTTDNMTTDEQQQRHNTILEVALYYLSNGWSNAYMEAQKSKKTHRCRKIQAKVRKQISEGRQQETQDRLRIDTG